MKRPCPIGWIVSLVALHTALGTGGCSKDSAGAASDAGSADARSRVATRDGGPPPLLAAPPWGSGPRPPIPDPPMPPDPNVPIGPVPGRAPDWDLDTGDGARDYARRYAYFTGRYSDGFSCMDFSASRLTGTQRRVEVRATGACPGAGSVRDVFLVDVAGDHITVDDKTARAPLARWPDGSDPEGQASREVPQYTNMPDWKSPMKDVLTSAGLLPIRVQGYGRGTYPVITLAAWHGAVQQGAPPDVLRPLADSLCKTGANMPFAILAAFDRSHLLRVRCAPTTTRWDTL
jgi:hypothetical protein